MSERLMFAPDDFSTDFIDDPSATEDKINNRLSIMPTTWIHGLLGSKDWAPSWLKEGYNRSVEGLAYEWLHGEPYFDKSLYNNQGAINDLLATIMSFATVGDVATLGAGSLVGKAAMGRLMAKSANMATKAGIPKKAAQLGAQHGAEQFYTIGTKMGLGKTIAAHSGVGAINLGFYEGLHSAVAQKAEKKDLNFLETLKSTARGAITGASIGATGTVFAKAPFMTKVPGLKSLKATGGLSRATVGEITAVGLLPAAEETLAGEPRLPTMTDFLYGAGLVSGLKIQHKAFSGAMRGIAKASGKTDYVDAANKFTPEEVAKEKRKIAETELKSGKELEHAKEEWSNKDNSNQVRLTDPNWRENIKNVETFEGEGRNKLLKRAHQLQDSMGISKEKAAEIKEKNFKKDSLKDFKESEIVDYMNLLKSNYLEVEYLKSSDPTKKGTKESMRAQDFFADYSRQPESKWISKDASINRRNEIKKMSQSLGETEADLKKNLEKLGVDDLKNVDGQNLVKIKDNYRDRLIVEDFVKDKSRDKEIRMHMVNMSPDGVAKSNLNNSMYGMFKRGLSSTKKAIGGSEWARLGVSKINNADFQHTYWNARLAQAYEAAGLSKLTEAQAINLNYVMTNLGGENYKREFAGTGKNRKQITRTITDASGKKKKINSVKGKDGKYLDLDIGQASPRNINRLMEYMYQKMKASGIPVKEKLPNYMPQLFKVEKLNAILDGVWKIHEDYSNLFGNELLGKKSVTAKEINRHFEKLFKSGNKKGEGVITEAGREVTPELVRLIRGYAEAGKGTPNNYYNAWQIASQNIFAEKTITAPHLEKTRRLEIPEDLKAEFLEQDARKLLLRYTEQFSKRLAFSQEFGLKGERMHAIIDKLRGKPQEQEALNRAYHAFTGMIDINPNFNYTKTWKNFYQNATNFMVATKIGLGFATIPNLTQSMISTAVKHGYTPMLKGWYKMWFDKPFQKRLLNSVGQTNTDMMRSMFGLDMGDVGFMSKFADKTTTYLGFNRINKFNYMLASATMYEKLLAHQRHAKGKGLGKNKAIRDRAMQELKKYGFANINENLNIYGAKGRKGVSPASSKTKTKIMKAMHEFARDSQLQRNVLNDPYLASNPKNRPFVLFKRFGVRQASWITENVSQEMFRYKNPLPVLRLIAGGAAGGLFVSSAKEAISDFLSGEDVFNENYTIDKIWDDLKEGDIKSVVEKVTLRDMAEAIGASGSLGWITDIIAAEDKLNAIEFLATPALAMDGMRIWDTLSSVITESNEFGIGQAVRRATKKGLPLFGSVPRLLGTRRIETRRQKVDYYTRRKTFVKNDILDAIISGNKTMAIRRIKEWNEVMLSSDVWRFSPGLIMDYEDIGPESISNRLLNRILKANDIPQGFSKYLK